MGDHYIIDGETGTLAVWHGTTSLAPVTNPEANANYLRFHSRRHNVGFLRAPRTGTVDVRNWVESGGVRRINLFAHGLPYRPLITGWLVVNGADQPLQGSVLHNHFAATSRGTFSYTIGVDATHVFINQLRWWNYPRAPSENVAKTISYQIFLSVYGLNASGGMRTPPFFNGVDLNAGANPARIRAGYFDSNYRYPFKSPSGRILLPRGETMSNGIGFTDGSAYNQEDGLGLGWRYSVNGLVERRPAYPATNREPGAVGNNDSFTAALTRLAMLGPKNNTGICYRGDPSTGWDMWDEDGYLIWSSSQKQAYITDYRTGSFTIPRFIGNFSTIDKYVIDLASVSPVATDVMGWFTASQPTAYGDAGVVNGAVHQLGGKTVLSAVRFNTTGSGDTYATHVTGPDNVAGFMAATTWVAGGKLKAQIERYMPAGWEIYPSVSAPFISFGSRATTITYHAFAIAYDN